MTLLGWSPPEGMGERFTLAEAAAVFGFERVNRAGARFDWEKLNWLNAQVLHGLSPRELLERLRPLWAAKGWPLHDDLPHDWLEELCALLGSSLTLLADGVAQAAPFFERPVPDDQAREALAKPEARACLEALNAHWPDSPILSPSEAQQLLVSAAANAAVKKGVVMKSLRAALLGTLQGPDLVATWQLLHQIGEDRERLERAVGMV
jgi:glutamyl-tRNA synthetase